MLLVHHLQLLELPKVLLADEIAYLGVGRLTELLKLVHISAICKLLNVLLNSEIGGLVSHLTLVNQSIQLSIT